MLLSAGRPPLLITGGVGFIGCNLADRLATEGESVLVHDSLVRPGVEANLAWLRKRHPRRVSTVIADVRDPAGLQDAVTDAAAVFHLAAQVAVTTSLVAPRDDLGVNLLGTFNLLEALRRKPVPCVFARTNKVYGGLHDLELTLAGQSYVPADPSFRRGVNECQTLDFRTPYGCSKGAADQYVLDYARHFGLLTVVLRMSCIYGPRQRGTEDQGWVAHFLLRALAGEPITIYGDGCQVRDVLFVDDAVRAYTAAWRRADRVAGQAFNLGGGPGNAVSLLQLIHHIEDLLDRPVEQQLAPWRPDDQRYYVSDTRKLRAALEQPEPLHWRAGVATLLNWMTDDGNRRSVRVAHGAALINPAWRFEHSIYFGCREPHLPLEFGYAKAALERHGHAVLLLDGHLFGLGADCLADAAQDFGADLSVVTSAPSYLFWRCAPPELRVPRDLIQRLHRRGIRTAAVGPHGSATPETTLNKLGADIVLRDECEDAIVALADTDAPMMVAGAAWREADGSVQVNGPPQATAFVDTPPLDWQDEWVARHRHHHHRFDAHADVPGAEVEASRGCPYACSFCAKIDFRDRYRRRRLDLLLTEIDALINQGVGYLYFIDEIFLPQRLLLEALCERDVTFGMQTRIDLWKPELIDLLGSAGCVSIEAGVESLTLAGRAAACQRTN